MKAAGSAFYLGMASENPEDNRAAMLSMLPTADDFALLFPEHGSELWKVWGAEASNFLKRAPELSPGYREGLPIVDVVIKDLREVGSMLEKTSLDLFPEEVPVYGGMVQLTTTGARVSKAFVFLRGRWVWVWDIDRVAGLIRRVEEGLEIQAPLPSQ